MSPSQAVTADLNHGISIPNIGGVADADDLVEFAVAADEGGWDGVFFGDHLLHPPDASAPDDYEAAFDPWITFAGIATQTDDIRLGTSVTAVPRRQPWQLARDLATLDRLSDGRVILGAGLGTTPDFTNFGQAYDTRRLGEQFDEALDVITGLWRGEPFSYDGDHYTIDEAVLLPTPVQEPRIPIVIGGWWPFKASFHRGGRWDGIVPNWPSLLAEFPEVDLDKMPDHIRAAAAKQRSHEEEIREMLAYYHERTDEPGEIMLYRPNGESGTSAAFHELCEELGVTWVIHRDVIGATDQSANLARIREGPPDRA